MATAYKVLKCLKGSLRQEILMKLDSSLRVSVYCDSDWARCPNTLKSVTGYSVFLSNSLVSWKSKKQLVVALSSTKAEYKSMVATCCEVIWLKNILIDFGAKQDNYEVAL